MNKELVKFIELCLADDEISDKERKVIFRKADELGVPKDECEIILEGLVLKNAKDNNKPIDQSLDLSSVKLNKKQKEIIESKKPHKKYAKDLQKKKNNSGFSNFSKYFLQFFIFLFFTGFTFNLLDRGFLISFELFGDCPNFVNDSLYKRCMKSALLANNLVFAFLMMIGKQLSVKLFPKLVVIENKLSNKIINYGFWIIIGLLIILNSFQLLFQDYI